MLCAVLTLQSRRVRKDGACTAPKEMSHSTEDIIFQHEMSKQRSDCMSLRCTSETARDTRKTMVEGCPIASRRPDSLFFPADRELFVHAPQGKGVEVLEHPVPAQC